VTFGTGAAALGCPENSCARPGVRTGMEIILEHVEDSVNEATEMLEEASNLRAPYS